MNGQRERQFIVRQVFEVMPVDVVVETGTYRGTTTQFLALISGAPVRTIESFARYFSYSRLRLAHLPQVRVEEGDSRSFLRRLSQEISESATIFFYLDAHWYEDLPLADELRIIAATWPRSVVLIDDFRVPDDPGYGYDDYGPGKTLEDGYLPWTDLPGWSALYPVARSEQETGARRGCVVLLAPAMSFSAPALTRLRPAPAAGRTG